MASHPDTRYRWNQKITKSQKKDLLTFAAGAGENYQKYLDFCAKFNIQTFSRGYWRNFVQRNRRTVQELRAMHIAAVAAEARMDRKARIQLLEDDIARIEGIFRDQFDELTVDQVVKLSDQKRKTLEAIAKERAEWGKEEQLPAQDKGDWLLEAVGKNLALAEAREAYEAPAVEAEVREVADV